MRTTPSEKDAALANLREMLPPSSTVYTILRHVSRSGMQREISLVVMRNGEPRNITYLAARVLDYRIGKRDGLVVGGCGMDMGFHIVHNLGYALYPDGFGCIGKDCPSNDHSNRDRDYTAHGSIGGCHEPVCTCHDPSAWTDNTYPNGCSACGCHRISHWHNSGGYALNHRWM